MDLRIMSINIWGDYFGNEVETRADGLISSVKAACPDVLGLQEATPAWHGSAFFAWLAEGYEQADLHGAAAHNYVPLFWCRDRFRALETGYVPYEDTPDKSKAATWAVLEDRDGARLAAFTTHFWYKTRGEEDDALRVSNANRLHAQALRLQAQYGVPVTAFGDMNCYPSHRAQAFFRENGWISAQETAPVTSGSCTYHKYPIRGEDGLYHGAKTEKGADASIDYILLLPAPGHTVRPLTFVLDESQAALDATDHSPIHCDAVIG